jgi:uncharacterized membrane protein YczE
MNKWKRLLFLFLGINLVALSVNLFLRANLGSDPLTVLQEGMHLALGISVGQASLLYNAIVLAVAFFFAKKRLGIGTFVYILLVGGFIDGYGMLFDLIKFSDLSLPSRIASFALGQLALSVGFALVIHVKFGTNGLDALLLVIEEKLTIPYRTLKTVADILYTLAGALMGGVVGLGTVVSMLTTGLLVSTVRKYLQKKEEIVRADMD